MKDIKLSNYISNDFYEKVTEKDMKCVQLKITSYSFNKKDDKKYYYGKLIFKDEKYNDLYSLELTREINLEEAEQMDNSDDSKLIRIKAWLHGERSTIKFIDEESIIILAHKLCRLISEKLNFEIDLCTVV